ncbi:MAG: DUF327 family protein [Treponema sp.]|jgi:uncharacterized protein YaaR (DUF327 family)|nr:DUF327 family protein [Treponema sp.]
MAKIDGADPAIFMNPSTYSGVKDQKKLKALRKNQKTDFSGVFNSLLGKTADELGPMQSLPVSDDSINLLMDDVRDAGDVLINRPLPQEILRYKQAVRNFINYIVKNNYSLEYEEGIQNKYKPGFKGRRNTPAAEKSKGYTKIQIIDKKLEDLAAMLLANQVRQLELVSRLEEIKGLLIDLLQ